ncbi:hypothetical protein H257_03447 [Aphanomyces astaci]|uniref:ISXO2-like transposase domain-containing protein n=1 Tax=Aphanomyces astaci TaxID=112090 RepID=W4GWS7_APHAT|nr:hypothetical protein H257_03447 [Aphanomyces astaci]ETV84160.1 hypothetical protein H257_03447 [Aphanomyces astaci]|eukprot:XP_009825852.1 hypothetical protein H257_03447 [Aphanomyces astaci]
MLMTPATTRPLDQVPMDDVPADVELCDMADVADFSWHVVLRVSADEETCIRWCMEVGLLAESMACEGGGHVELGMRFKFWFQGSRIPMTKLVRLLFAWASRKPLGVVIVEEEISTEAGVDWYNYCRELCSSEMLRSPMVWSRSEHEEMVQVVTGADRTKPTLSHLITKHIAPGSHIVSDKFGSYVSSNERHTLVNNPLLANQDYRHDWVNHSENFVNPQNGAHTQSIEGAWEIRIKQFAKAMRGMHRPHLPSYLDEYLWRSWYFPLGPDGIKYFKGLVCAIGKNHS